MSASKSSQKLVETSEKSDINESYTRRLQDEGSWEDYQTYEMRYPLSLAMTGLKNFGYDHQLQDFGLVPEFSLATQIFIADSNVEIRDSFLWEEKSSFAYYAADYYELPNDDGWERIGIIKVKDELLTYPEIKSMMRAEKK